MPDPLRTPPPSLNEAMIDRHFATDPYNNRAPVADPVLSMLRDAMASGRAAAEKAKRIADAVLANEMQTLPARHRSVKDEAWKAVDMPLKRFDAALAAARHEIDALEARTMAPPRPSGAADAMLASEVRARLASLPEGDRREALEAALVAGDDAVIGAALHGPAMLSGMTTPQHSNLRDRWRGIRHGEAMDRINRLKAALADTERGGTLLVGYTSTLVDSNVVELAEASEKAARKAIES